MGLYVGTEKIAVCEDCGGTYRLSELALKLGGTEKIAGCEDCGGTHRIAGTEKIAG